MTMNNYLGHNAKNVETIYGRGITYLAEQRIALCGTLKSLSYFIKDTFRYIWRLAVLDPYRTMPK